MPYLHDDILDAALQYIEDNVENLYICSAEPTTFAEANSTYKLGSKATPTITGPANGDTSGRKTTVDAITDGSVTGTGTATHWALTDDSASKLLATGALASSQAVTSGNTFSLTAFDIEIPDPA
jgi:hypothetical protein